MPGFAMQGAGGIALFGMSPSGRQLAAHCARQGVVLTNTLQELNDLALCSTGSCRQLHSIILVGRPDDDFSIASQIYMLAVNLHILVTAILIHDPVEAGNHPVSGLHAVSDIIVHSPDPGCIEDILDSMAG